MDYPRGIAAAIVIVACGACSTSAPSPDTRISDTSAAPPVETSPAPAPATTVQLLPDGRSAGGWIRAGEPERYGPGDLWEYIDGGAERYLDFGFQELATAKYTFDPEATATVDVYRMSDHVHAFGIFAEETGARGTLLPLGVEGRAGAGTIRFWAGDYFAKITASPPTAATAGGLQSLAKAVADRIGAPGAPPTQLSWFPSGGLIPGSIRFVPADLLGQSYLTSAFEAKYSADAKTWRLLIVPGDSEDAAADALARYAAFLRQGDRAMRTLATPGDGGVVATDSFHGRIVAVRSGSSLVIAVGAPDEKSAGELVASTIEKMMHSSTPPTRQATQ